MKTSLCAAGLACVALAGTAWAGDPRSDQADLTTYGPLIGGETLLFNLRTTPNSPVFAFFGFANLPAVPTDPLLPVVSPAPVTNFFLFGSDANGLVQIFAPTNPNQFLALAGLKFFAQALVITPNLDVVASNVRATEFEPSDPGVGFFVNDAATALPAGSDFLGANEIEHGDLNRDGFEDVVIATDFDVRIWINDGTGAFFDGTVGNLAHGGAAVSTIRLGDADADNDLDLVVAGGFDDFVTIPDVLWLNDGTGSFSLGTALPVVDGLRTDFEFGDVDGDGDMDLFAANGPEDHLKSPGGLDQLYINQGRAQSGTLGEFVADATFENMAWNESITATEDIEIGDLNGDGHLDVYVSKSDTDALLGNAGELNRMLFGDGTGLFTDVTLTNIDVIRTDNTQDSLFVDLDGDGDYDIVSANSVFSIGPDESADVLINQGGFQFGFPGTFVDDTTSFLDFFTGNDGIRLGVEAADIDADGDMDVFCAIHDFFPAAPQLLFLNQGGAQGGTTGDFLRQFWFPSTGYIAADVALFDADNDGHTDILLPANGILSGDPATALATRYWRNTLRTPAP